MALACTKNTFQEELPGWEGLPQSPPPLPGLLWLMRVLTSIEEVTTLVWWSEKIQGFWSCDTRVWHITCVVQSVIFFIYIFLQGEKNNGFDILYHNMKYGQDASKELADFLRERSVPVVCSCMVRSGSIFNNTTVLIPRTSTTVIVFTSCCFPWKKLKLVVWLCWIVTLSCLFSCSVEENYAKMLAKLARYCSNCSTKG